MFRRIMTVLLSIVLLCPVACAQEEGSISTVVTFDEDGNASLTDWTELFGQIEIKIPQTEPTVPEAVVVKDGYSAEYAEMYVALSFAWGCTGKTVGDALVMLHELRQLYNFPLALEIGNGAVNDQQHAMTVIIGRHIRVLLYVAALAESPTPEAEETFQKIVTAYPIGDLGFFREDTAERRREFLARFSPVITSCQIVVSSPFVDCGDWAISDEGIDPEFHTN